MRTSVKYSTKFSPVFRYIKERKLRNSVLIYFTDGVGEKELEVKPFKNNTIWVLTGDEDLSLEKPYGEIKKITTKAEKGEVFDTNIVKEDLYDLYAQGEFASMTKVSEVIAKVKEVNSNIVSILFKNNVSLNPKNLLETLTDSRLGLTNVIENNREAYNLELSDFQRVGDSKELVKLVSRVNYKEAVLAAKTTADVKANLVEYALLTGTTSVTNAKDTVRNDIAEELLSIFKGDKAPDLTLVDFIRFNSEISNADYNRKAKIDKFNEVMVGETGKANPEITTAVEQLKGISPEFKALSASQQLVVAEKVIANLPANKDGVKTAFTNYTEIRTLVSKCL